ncbi:MAG TPA: serine/threonine-protein kinase, partial [Minicystis sp.]|nr:serine/threonine-protein kinase [Minicystis sp.]
MRQGARLGNKYVLAARLGVGSAGTVWSAENELTGRHVAIKVLHAVRGAVDEEARERLLREARACGRIHHKNVVEIYDVGAADDGTPFLVMQLLEGETLEQRLARVGKLEGGEAGAIAFAVASGLAAAHDAHVIHRDLKPVNIFLCREPSGRESLKILDFGVSKLLAAEPSNTVTGNPLGSPAYMAPEQARADKTVDARADLWALGV